MGEVIASGEVLLGRRGKRIYEVIFSDGNGTIHAKWFHYSRKFWEKRFKTGEKFLLFGDVDFYRGVKQIVHPEAQSIKEFFDEEELQKHLGLIPVYPSTEGLQQRQIRKALSYLLEEGKELLQETLPDTLLAKYNLPPLLDSFLHIHQPGSEDNPDDLAARRTPYHRRLAFEEFFYLQLGLHLRRSKTKENPGYLHKMHGDLARVLLKTLPFELTAGQQRSIQEIYQDMCSEHPMNRLLQGDVGSGKTLVCMLAVLLAFENGNQSAIMVPTEILAEQHEKNFRKLLAPLGVPIYLLTASTKENERQAILSKMAAGEPGVVIGTHAILEDDVRFLNLSLAVIDEQHRFGVRQRMKLIRKTIQPDVLVMTATPIPRSLAMTLYGDLDLSLMTEMPAGRQVILTRIMQEKDRPKLLEFVRKKVQEGRQVYFIFPLIEESEKLDLKDAKKGFEKLKEIFPKFSLAMLHGRMKSKEKEEVMGRFSRGEVDILVATTVVEVGIDVPNATLMVVEHAERFGLSQLHQLRGRVGRGREKSYCVLAADYRRSELARERLKVMEESVSGFKIAEEDLKIRGPGDFLGIRQSGIPELRVANLVTDLDLLEEAKQAVEEFLREDPQFQFPKNQWMRSVLEHRWSGRLGLAEVG